MCINYKVLTDLDQPLFHVSRKEFLTSTSITRTEQAVPNGFLVRNRERKSTFDLLGCLSVTLCNLLMRSYLSHKAFLVIIGTQQYLISPSFCLCCLIPNCQEASFPFLLIIPNISTKWEKRNNAYFQINKKRCIIRIQSSPSTYISKRIHKKFVRTTKLGKRIVYCQKPYLIPTDKRSLIYSVYTAHKYLSEGDNHFFKQKFNAQTCSVQKQD